MVVKARCKDCPKRHATCHTTCKDYKEFVIANAKLKKKIQEEKRKYYESLQHIEDTEKEIPR